MNHLELFLVRECSPALRVAIESELSDESVRWKRFEFNLYNITIERDKDRVVIQDVLDGEAPVQTVSLNEFTEALKRCSAPD